MLSFTATTSTRLLLRSSCLRLAHHRSPFAVVRPSALRQFTLGSVRLLPRIVHKTVPGTPKNGEQQESVEIPTFREELIKEDPALRVEKFEQLVGRPGIWKQVAFVLIVSTLTYGYAADVTNFDTKKWTSIFPASMLASSENLRGAKVALLAEKMKKKLQQMREAASDLPQALTYPFLWAYVQVCNSYINAPEGKRIAYQICAINGVVWLMWQFSRLQPFMHTFFMHNPLSGRYVTLLYSMFSHKSFIHLAFNSFALCSFGSAATAFLVRKQAENKERLQESTPKYHFWAVYLGAGLFSGLVSHVVAARITFPRMLAQLSPSAETASTLTAPLRRFRKTSTPSSAVKAEASAKDIDILPSLGASGAIYAMVTMTALAFPDAQVFLLFPPIPLPITYGVGGMVAMDILGVLRGWKMFDHWAHLGGGAFGAVYFKYGPDLWNNMRAQFAQIDRERDSLVENAKSNN